jgi:hypothetical protein
MSQHFAPWTLEEIGILAERQLEAPLHPYTCGNNSRHQVLVPTKHGWICIDCDYTQDWAFEQDFKERWWVRQN